MGSVTASLLPGGDDGVVGWVAVDGVDGDEVPSVAVSPGLTGCGESSHFRVKLLRVGDESSAAAGDSPLSRGEFVAAGRICIGRLQFHLGLAEKPVLGAVDVVSDNGRPSVGGGRTVSNGKFLLGEVGLNDAGDAGFSGRGLGLRGGDGGDCCEEDSTECEDGHH